MRHVYLALCMVFLLGIAAAGHGAVYYVSPEGDDAAAGSRDAPFKTIARAHEAASPGDTVTALAGVYDLGPQGLVSSKAGTPDAPITFMAEHTGRATLTNRTAVNGWQQHQGAVYRAAAETAPAALFMDDDILFPATADTVHLTGGERGGEGHWWYENGHIYLQTWTGNSPAEHTIWRSDALLITLAEGSAHQVWDGFRLMGAETGVMIASGEGHVVQNCTIYAMGTGIVAAVPCLVQHNYISHIGCFRHHSGIRVEASGVTLQYNRVDSVAGIGIYLAETAEQCVLLGNEIRDPRDTHAITMGAQVAVHIGGAGGHRVVRNLMFGPHRIGLLVASDNNLLANNTVTGTIDAALWAYSDLSGSRVLNNVLGSAGPLLVTESPFAALSHNLYIGSGPWGGPGQWADSLADWQRTGVDTNSMQTLESPFVDEWRRDFAPAAEGTLVNAGTPVEGVTDNAVGAPDIGAFEHGAPAPPRAGPQVR